MKVGSLVGLLKILTTILRYYHFKKFENHLKKTFITEEETHK
jgi:hypothetical protein